MHNIRNNSRTSHKSPVLSLIAFAALLFMVFAMLSGCSAKSTEGQNIHVEDDYENKRFVVEHFNVDNHSFVHIITDNETGEQYLFYKFGSQGGLTKLESE